MKSIPERQLPLDLYPLMYNGDRGQACPREIQDLRSNWKTRYPVSFTYTTSYSYLPQRNLSDLTEEPLERLHIIWIQNRSMTFILGLEQHSGETWLHTVYTAVVFQEMAKLKTSRKLSDPAQLFTSLEVRTKYYISFLSFHACLTGGRCRMHHYEITDQVVQPGSNAEFYHGWMIHLLFYFCY